MNEKGKTNVKAEDILVTSGSQQALDFAGNVFLDEGDIVLCESPSYLGALNAFKGYKPRIMEVPTDKEGMITEGLEKILKENDRVKFIYVIPDFQNPTGVTWSLDRRKKFMEVVNKSIPFFVSSSLANALTSIFSPFSVSTKVAVASK